MGGRDIEAGGELEGFTFANTMLWADLLSQTILKGVVDTSELPFCYSSFFILISFFACGNIKVDIHIFQATLQRSFTHEDGIM